MKPYGGTRGDARGLLSGGLLAATFAALLIVFSALAPAHADPSPRIAPSKIAIDEPVRQGDDVRLPGLSVANQGDERSTVGMDTLVLSDQEERSPDRSWFDFDPEEFELAPGEGQVVNVRMRVPRDATPGDYKILLRARTKAPEGQAAGVSIGVAVASTLTFTVENVNFHFYDPLTDFFTERAPFSYIGLALLALAAAIEFLRRRYRLRWSLGVERRE